MIPMRELEITTELTELISAEFPAYLLATEEEMPITARLPPLRYVGKKQNMPAAMGGPILLIELETAEPTIKDRIIKQTVYHIDLKFKGMSEETVYFYIVALKTLLENGKYQIALIDFLKGTVDLMVKRRG